MKVRVRVRVALEIEFDYDVPEEIEPSDVQAHLVYRFQEHECLGTGFLGAAFEEFFDRERNSSVCWACNLKSQQQLIWWSKIKESK